MKKFLCKPYLAICFLLIAIVAAVICHVLPKYDYYGTVLIQPYIVYEIVDGQNGIKAYNDGNEYIYCADEFNNIIYMLDANNEDAETVYYELCFGDDNHLYVHKIVYEKDAYLTASENISEYDENGKFVKYIAYFDYSDTDRKPQRRSRITGLNFTDGHIRYVYRDYGDIVKFYSCDPDTLITECEGTYVYPGNAKLKYAKGLATGDYAVIMNNGEVGRLSLSGEYTTLADSDYNVARLEKDFIPIDLFVYGNDIYVISGTLSKDVYKITEGGAEFITDCETVTGDTEWSSVIEGVYLRDGKTYVVSNSCLYEIDANGNPVEYEYLVFTAPHGKVIGKILKNVCPHIAIIAGVLGLILLIGALAKWKSSLLLKQLCLTIPLVILLVAGIVYTMYLAIMDAYEKNLTSQMVAITELISRNIDADEVAAIKDFSSVDDGTIQKYCDMLNEYIDYNTGYWNKNFDIGLYLYDDDRKSYLEVASNCEVELPFQNVYFDYDDTDYSDRKVPDSMSDVLYIETGMVLTEMVVDTPIYDSFGNYVAIVELSSDCSTIDEKVETMVKKVAVIALAFLVVIIMALSIISYVNIRQLGKLNAAMTEISKGDFKVRINKMPKDEVGEICANVNDMAAKLDDYFSTKDRNEKFYYKFVPEKFRELLHKEEFTDLALGDAESADLTVLFCDIRAFSLNSEMMTAKENFEFVNVIYGKAGPIIRKHRGFVDKYIGDAIMALFENADDAVNAGREIYREIVLNPDTAKELNVSSINIGVGIHSGMARIGIVGEDERMAGTVISNTVNLSSRLESLTKRYAAAILISKDTLDRLSDPDSLNTRYLGMIQVAGVNEVKAVYEVLDALGEEDCAFKTSQKEEFREAIRLFHLGNPEDSIAILEELKAEKEASKANDPAIDMYLEYIKEEVAAGNKDHKIFRFSRK